jgi:uncharacterized membrane protein YccC
VLLMVIAGLLAMPRGAVGYVGVGLAVVVAVVTLVGSLGETFSPDPVTAPRSALVVSGVIGVAIAAAILVTVVHDVRVRRARASTGEGALPAST